MRQTQYLLCNYLLVKWHAVKLKYEKSSSMQSSAVIMRSNIIWYHIHHCRNWGRISIRGSTHNPKKIWNLRITGLREGNPPVTGEFPSQRTSNAENVCDLFQIQISNFDELSNWPLLAQGMGEETHVYGMVGCNYLPYVNHISYLVTV